MFSDILGYQQEFSEDTSLSSRRLRKRDKVKRMIRRVSVAAVCVCVCVCVNVAVVVQILYIAPKC